MRILSLHPAATEALFAIGAGDLIVGRTDACDYPEQAKMIPTAGKEVSRVVAEVFEPDLIVLGPGQDALKEELVMCRTIVFSPETLEGITREFALLGEIVGRQLEADIVVHEINTFLDHAREKAKRFKKVRVYVEGPGYVSDIVEAVGGIPFRGEATVEAIQAFDPHMMLILGDEEHLELLTARDGWGALGAVRNERIFCMHEQLFRPGPRLQDGISKIAMILHGV